MTEQQPFQAEIGRLLNIVANSLYSDKNVFLRELISNASDACDRLRYMAITAPSLAADDPLYTIVLTVDKEAGTLTITDNGIGMNRTDLVDHLSTLARSGTLNFLEQMSISSPEKQQSHSLIGKFGVGFYSAFIVADQVDIYTRKASENEIWHWSSNGKETFSIEQTKDVFVLRGTRIILHLKPEEQEFLNETHLRNLVSKYSDHIDFPIYLGADHTTSINTASALWKRAPADITAEQYKEFYHHIGAAFDDPWLTIHWQVEGMITYTALLFIPTSKPLDLFDPHRPHGVKLYINRVFINEGVEGLLPSYLRFIRGIIDSADLPLNISREILQNNTILTKIKKSLIKRILNELKSKATNAEDSKHYSSFWESFGAVLKEGLYHDRDYQDSLLELARFHSTYGQGLVSLTTYVDRMVTDQESIFFITGDSIAEIEKSPHLEGFRACGIEVLFMTDPIDEFWLPIVTSYQGKTFQSVTRGTIDLDKFKREDTATEIPSPSTTPSVDALIEVFRTTLGEAVKDVRSSKRLSDSAVCLVADEGDMDMRLERMLRQYQSSDVSALRVLEINPHHSVIRKLAETIEHKQEENTVQDAIWLLFDQARLLEGEALSDSHQFSRRLSIFLERGLEFLPVSST